MRSRPSWSRLKTKLNDRQNNSRASLPCEGARSLRTGANQNHRPGGTMQKLKFRLLSCVGTVVLASGCSAIELDRLQPPQASGSACRPAAMPLQAPAGEPAFGFVLPRASAPVPGEIRPLGALGAAPVRVAPTFAAFVQGAATTKRYLPTNLQDEDVTNAVFAFMVKSSARAQVAAAAAAGAPGTGTQQAQVEDYSVPARLTHAQLKRFADRFFDSQLRPTIVIPNTQLSAAAATPGSADTTNTFAIYFSAYYEGKFIDRLGQSVQKPQLSLTVPDAEISAALTVLTEYLVDLLNPTPVLGDAASAAVITPQTKSTPKVKRTNQLRLYQSSRTTIRF